MPPLFYAEGGEGWSGDTDRLEMNGPDGQCLVQFAKRFGLVAVVGVVSGYRFPVMHGRRDVVIAKKDTTPRPTWLGRP
ncbi:hypothetical protein [Bradyrhizobium elkanii]|uniref:hypothetical protein n=1 Tax=Bradyrhizobium elkanii TaxID=29448 RepID=UPI001BA7E79F|nr:hypothetical protein [Bradyrhizobium elkanii]MBR1165230.1 hypothetical protein [Bradyrhizobium elkanii]